MQIKICNKCKQSLPHTTDFFYKRGIDRRWKSHLNEFGKRKLEATCKECAKARQAIHNKNKVWIRGVSKHRPQELIERRRIKYNKKHNLKLTKKQYAKIDVYREFLRLNKCKLNKLEKRLKTFKPKTIPKTFEQKKQIFFNKYNINKSEQKEYSKCNTVSSLMHRYRYKNDKEFNLNMRVKNQLRKIKEKYPNIGNKLRQNIKKGKNVFDTFLGYSTNDLAEHLEKKFTEDMNWQNFFDGDIHIDHIKPKSLFDLHNDKQIRKCWSLENLQPLWAKDNLTKSNKYYADKN
jgi:hypothetical protein